MSPAAAGDAPDAPDRRSAGRRHGAAAEPGRGLCPRCRHVRRLTSQRGSTFLLCTLSKADERFPKYPPQPVVACSGFGE